MPTGGRRISRNDLEFQKVATRFRLWQIAVYAVSTAVVMVVLTFPLRVTAGMVEDLAGKDTNVNAAVGLTVSMSLSVVINGLQYVTGRSRRSEIQRMRERIKVLETRLGIPEVGTDDDG